MSGFTEMGRRLAEGRQMPRRAPNHLDAHNRLKRAGYVLEVFPELVENGKVKRWEGVSQRGRVAISWSAETGWGRVEVGT